MITIEKAHWLVKFGLNKIDSQTFTDVSPNIIDENLNKSQLTVIRNKLSNNLGLEYNRAIMTDLAPITIINEMVTPVGNKIDLSDLNHECLRYIRGYVVGESGNCTKRIPIFDRKLDNRSLLSRYQKSSFLWNRAVGYFSEDYLIIEDADFNLEEAYIDYLKYPSKVCLGTYVGIDNNPTTTSNFDFKDEMIYEIIYHTIFELASNLQYPDSKMKFDISQLTNII
jgi:hypothetical protein